MRGRIVTTVLAFVFVWLAANAGAQAAAVRRISRAALEDKVRGGWAGQMIGVKAFRREVRGG